MRIKDWSDSHPILEINVMNCLHFSLPQIQIFKIQTITNSSNHFDRVTQLDCTRTREHVERNDVKIKMNWCHHFPLSNFSFNFSPVDRDAEKKNDKKIGKILFWMLLCILSAKRHCEFVRFVLFSSRDMSTKGMQFALLPQNKKRQNKIASKFAWLHRRKSSCLIYAMRKKCLQNFRNKRDRKSIMRSLVDGWSIILLQATDYSEFVLFCTNNVQISIFFLPVIQSEHCINWNSTGF